MGQHKYNSNCQLAREGKLPPKPKSIGKRELERLMFDKCQEVLYKPLVDAYTKMQIEEKEFYNDLRMEQQEQM